MARQETDAKAKLDEEAKAKGGNKGSMKFKEKVMSLTSVAAPIWNQICYSLIATVPAKHNRLVLK
jgi:hypothetical protein